MVTKSKPILAAILTVMMIMGTFVMAPGMAAAADGEYTVTYIYLIDNTSPPYNVEKAVPPYTSGYKPGDEVIVEYGINIDPQDGLSKIFYPGHDRYYDLWEFSHWERYDGDNIGSIVNTSFFYYGNETFEMPEQNVWLIAYWKITAGVEPFDINYEAGQGGYVEPTSERIGYTEQDAEGSWATPFPGYYFVNWTKNGDAVSTEQHFIPVKEDGGVYEEATYRANFAENDDVTIEYVATFGGAVSLSSESVPPDTGKPIGSTATADTGYKFVYWSNERGDFVSTDEKFIPNKSGDGIYEAATYYANFAPSTDIEYTIQYLLSGGNDKLAPDKLVTDRTMGETVTEYPIPITGHTPTESSKSYTLGPSDNVIIFYYEPNTYTVTFIDWDKTVLKTQEVPYGCAATPPASPSRDKWEFNGWDTDFSFVTEDLIVEAAYEPLYFVTYDGNGHDGGTAPVDNEKYYMDEEVTVKGQEDLVKTGHSFLGWSKDYAATTATYTSGSTFNIDLNGDVTLYAIWEAVPASETYTVTYLPGVQAGAFAPQVTSGLASGDATPAAPSVTVPAGWRFTGWSPARSATVTGDVTYTAQWEQIRYAVTFAPGTNGAFAPQTSSGLTYGSPTPSPPATIGQPGWNFIGWIPSVSGTVTENATYTAQWEPILYSVSYLPGEKGTFAPQVTTGLLYGAPTPAAPMIEGEDGWSFTGWSPGPSGTVTANAAYVAQWEEDEDTSMLTVTFVDWDGTVLKTQQVPAGGNATAPADPSREGFVFTGWDRGYTNVRTNITVTAQYTPVAVTNTETIIDGPVELESLPVFTQQEVLEMIKESGMPVISIGGLEIPLVAGTGMQQHVWALVNLILALLGIMLAIATVVRTAAQKRREKIYDGEIYIPEGEEQKNNRRLGWIIMATIFGIFGIIVFFLTEDTRMLMVLLDNWTIVNAVIFVLAALSYKFAFKRVKDDEYENAGGFAYKAIEPA